MLRASFHQLSKKFLHLLTNTTKELHQVYGTRAIVAATNSHDLFNTHQESPENNANVKFEFTKSNYEIAQEIIDRYPVNYKRSAVIPLLDLAQKQNGGWIHLGVMNKIAEILEMPEIRVYEVATFYTMFNRSKIGKYHILVCGTTPCMLQGSDGIVKALSESLEGLKFGQTTEDGMFTLSEMECMGCCVNAPMIAVADYTKGVEGFSYNYYEDLTPKDAVEIVNALKKGNNPPAGSKYRKKAEPAGTVLGEKWIPMRKGEVTLNTEPRGPYAPSLE